MEELKKLLEEWKTYKRADDVPNRILEPELVSIARAVDLELKKLIESKSCEVTEEEQQTIDEIYNFLKQRASNT